MNVSVYASVLGLNNAIAILVAISHGERDAKNCERVLQRGKLVALTFYLIISPVIFYSKEILTFVKVER